MHTVDHCCQDSVYPWL